MKEADYKNKIDIKIGFLFPRHFLFLAGIVLIIGLGLITERTSLSIFLMITSVFVLSAYSGTEIDKAENTYREYNSFFLIKSGKKVKYSGIEKIYITSSKVTQQVYSRSSQSAFFTNTKFNGYLKLDQGKKIYLLNKRKKENLVRSLKKISAFLNVPIEDNTVATK